MDISKDSDQSLVKKCFEFCSALTDRGCSYSFSLKLGQSFNFSLKSEKGAPPKAKPKRSPSYLRRQLRRREDFLKKRSGSSPENVDAAPRHTQPVQNEEAAVDNSCQLDLCPRPVDPRKSEGSVESEDYDAIQQWASDGTATAKSEPVPHCDCGKCRKNWVREKEESSRLETWMRSDEKTSFNSYGQRMRWSEVRDYHMRHLVIAETDCEWGGLITLGDLRKANYRCEDEFTVQNGKLKCNQKPSCNGVFSAEKYWGHWYLRCEECNPLLTKCGKFDGGFSVPKCKCSKCKEKESRGLWTFRLKSFVGYTKNKQ